MNFGACNDFDNCRELLRISPAAMQVISQTEDGALFRFHRRNLPYHAIGGEAISLRHQILEGAIVKALAGPQSRKERSIWPTGPRLVERLMVYIYVDTMYNLVRRLKEPGPSFSALV